MELSDGLMLERKMILWLAVMIGYGLVYPFILELIDWYRENKKGNDHGKGSDQHRRD